MDSNRFSIINDEGIEKEMEILFTFDGVDNDKKYVLFTNIGEDDVFAASYTDDGSITLLDPDVDIEEWNMVEEVFGAFTEGLDTDEEE
ncbi:MAG: DUF1292 domain-containing protein [Anaerorhabdus sp.]